MPAEHIVEQFDGVDLHRCPSLLVEPWTQEVIWTFPLFRKGTLLEDGGLGNQGAFWLDCMYIIDALRTEKEIRDRDIEAGIARRDASGVSGPKGRPVRYPSF